ncbi:EpsG family protein [Escherichia coli]|uniref:EpsG family protein n=1 Tax=Escherichia coli TaxID=562 RepID=UPI00332CB01F
MDIILFYCFALISVSLKYNIIKKSSPFLLLSVLVYYSNTFILQDLTQIRAGLRGHSIIFSVTICKNKNIISFVMLILLASTFHITALLFLLFSHLILMQLAQDISLFII